MTKSEVFIKIYDLKSRLNGYKQKLMENHMEKILFAKQNGILDRVLISHDAGWYDPQLADQSFKPFTNIFKELYPALKEKGFKDDDFHLLVSVNPSKAYSIEIREHATD